MTSTMDGTATGRRIGPQAIDPRIRARRIEVRRVEGRRRLQRILEAVALSAVALAFLAALRSPLLDVDRIVVAGEGHTSAEAIRAAAAVTTGTQLIDLDLGAIGEQVATLPWVQEATVARDVDGSLEITVTERTPVSQVRTADGSTLLVDATGRALGPVEEAPALAGSLVTLTGVVDDLEPGQHLPGSADPVLQVASVLGDRLGGIVAEVSVQEVPGGGEVIAGRLAAGGTVRFGDASQLDAKLLSLVTVIDQVDRSGLAVLDLRLPSNPVLTREQG